MYKKNIKQLGKRNAKKKGGGSAILNRQKLKFKLLTINYLSFKSKIFWTIVIF